MIGEYYDLEDRHFSDGVKRKYFQKEVYGLLYEWDNIRFSDKVKQDIEEVDPKLIAENLSFTDEYRK